MHPVAVASAADRIDPIIHEGECSMCAINGKPLRMRLSAPPYRLSHGDYP